MTSEIWDQYQADGPIPAQSALAPVTEKDICLCSQTGCLSDPAAAAQQELFCAFVNGYFSEACTQSGILNAFSQGSQKNSCCQMCQIPSPCCNIWRYYSSSAKQFQKHFKMAKPSTFSLSLFDKIILSETFHSEAHNSFGDFSPQNESLARLMALESRILEGKCWTLVNTLSFSLKRHHVSAFLFSCIKLQTIIFF